MRHTFQVTLGKEIPDIFLVEDVIRLLAVSQQEACTILITNFFAC